MLLRYYKVIVLLLGWGLVVSCQNLAVPLSRSKSIIPSYIYDPKERLQYLITHYWDSVDFADSLWVRDREELKYKFDDYFHLLSSGSNIQRQQLLSPLASLDGKLLEDVLGYYRDYYQSPPITAEKDAYYSHVLLWSIRSPKVSLNLQQEAKVVLRRILKNRVGVLATNFEYRVDSLNVQLNSGWKPKYRLLLLSPSGGEDLSVVYNYLFTEPIYKSLTDKKSLRTTIICLGESIMQSDSLCPPWVEKGGDVRDTIRRYGLYDVGDKTSVYLLDRDMRVLLKNPQWKELTKYLEEYGKR